MTKKAVGLVTGPRGFLQKKASNILSEISDGTAAPRQSAIRKKVIRMSMEQERSSKLTTKCPVRCNLT